MSIEPKIVIRDYVDSDAGDLISLIRELQAHELALFDRMKHPDDMGDWYIEHLKQQIDQHGGRFLIAESNAEIIGYATVLITVPEDSADEISYNYAMVSDIVVAQNYRGLGIGKTLLTECEKHALHAGAKWLRITALAANDHALAMYRRAGFTDLLVDLEKPLG